MSQKKIVEITVNVFYVQCATLCIEFRYSEASVVLETIQISGTALRLNHRANTNVLLIVIAVSYHATDI